MRGLTFRLTLSYLLVAIITLGGAGLLSYRFLAPLFSISDQTVQRTKAEAAFAAAVFMVNRGADSATIRMELERTYSGIKVIETPISGLDQRGTRVMGGWVREQLGPEPSLGNFVRALQGEFDTPFDRRVIMVDTQGRPTGLLRIVPTAVPGESGPLALQRALIGAGTIGLAAALLLAFGLSRTLIAPLQRMATAAGRLADGEWETPLPIGGPTEIRSLAEAFHGMSNRLRADFQQIKHDRERLQHLTAEVAHELRTPVASLRTYHELLLDGEQENQINRAELLRRGALQVGRLEYLTNFLVEMARLQAHSVEIDRVERDLVDLVRQAAAAIELAADQRKVVIQVDATDRALPVLVDPHRIGQAMDNLLQNALRFTPDGGRIRIWVQPLSDGKRAEVIVQDDGPGIDPEIMPRLFEPFARGPGSLGLGIGLAVVRAVAATHDGAVQATNRPQGGAEFRLSIPLHES